MAAITPNLAFWDGIHESIHSAFIDAFSEEVLNQSLTKREMSSASPNEKYSRLKALTEQELTTLGDGVAQDSHRVQMLTHLKGMLQGEESDYQGATATWHQLVINQHPSRPNLAALFNLAGVLEQQHRYMESEWILRTLVPLLQLKIADDSPQAIGGVRNLARCVSKQGRKAEAKDIVEVAM